MPHSKPNLPTKTCKSCGLPFTWGKKWQNCWHEVHYCSMRCRQPSQRLSATLPPTLEGH